MSTESVEQRLSRISTQWTLLGRAHGPHADEAAAAQRLLFQRYGGAVHKYLLGALRDPDAAMEVFQDFAVRFLSGDFQRANPAKGRFRDYVKRALINLVHDYHRKQKHQELPMRADFPEAVAPDPTPAEEDLWLDSWRSELLARAWTALETSDPVHHTVLQCRVQSPDATAAEIADQVALRAGKSFTPGALRVALHRARERFADALVDEVANSLADPTTEQVISELTGLRLLAYCEPVLEKHAARNNPA